ncbi:phospholipid carrier-dependent glycosyltransferase [Planococcus dechangensis]|uniref:Phospholipid carrier-dependent glycosyltransferase n=1 Tax=Planococcus dechangensis TaxID=1176255 RepID=A0ABV9MB84_9BACL
MSYVLGFFVIQILATFLIKDFLPPGEVYSMLLVFTGIVAISLYLYRNLKNEWLFIIFIGFAVRVIILFIDLYVPSIGIFSSGTDTEYFHEVSVLVANGQYPLDQTHTVYVPFLSALYYMVGDQRAYSQFLNIACWVFSVVFLFKTLNYLQIEKNLIFIAMLIFTLMPNSIFMSSILLREALIIFFTTVSLFYFIRWVGERSFLQFGWAVVLSILAMTFHSGMIGLVFVYIASFVWLERNKMGKQISTPLIYLLFIASITFIIFQNSDLFLSKFVNDEGAAVDYEIFAEGGSVYLASFSGLSGVAALLVAPLKMFYFLFSPLPLDWRGGVDMVSFLFDSSVYLFLIGATFYGLYRSQMPLRTKIFILLVIGVTVFIYSYGTQSAGTAMRHRNKIIPLLLLSFASANSRQLLDFIKIKWIGKKGEKVDS